MANERHIENRFLAVSRRHIGRLMQNLEPKWRITCRYRTRDQNCNFRKFKMADGRQFENSILFISQLWKSDFDQISYTDADFHSEDGLWHKIEILQIQDGGRTPYWNRFLAISRCHIGQLMRNLDRRWIFTCRCRSHDRNGNFSQIQDGGRPPYRKSFFGYILAPF